jgi:D-alanyl-D-alanine carboxypeptidase
MSRGRVATTLLLVVVAWVTAVALAGGGESNDDRRRAAGPEPRPAVTPDAGTAPTIRPNPLAVEMPAAGPPLRLRLRPPPRAGILFDVETGEVLWAHRPEKRAPIASLTKMMTALVIAERHRARERVLITPQATGFAGSGIGLLPEGRRVPLGPLLYGLMLVSGNDAAIALAQHDAGGQKAFVARMNARARRLGLSCTRFSSPSGILDRGNWSCPLDLATLARLDLRNRWVARIIGARRARFRFPVKGGVLDLFNINPFIARGDEGVTGVKTGLTSAAGRCYVITAKIGGRHLGVVLLDTLDPVRQVPRLLRAGARLG